MKVKKKFKVVDSVDIFYSDGDVTGHMCGRGQVKGIITSGNRVQLFDVAIEDLPADADLGEHLIRTYCGLPYMESYRTVEKEIEIDDPAEKESV